MPALNHFVITRFSYKGANVFSSIGGPTFLSKADPLDPSRLELRFKLLEISCLPSVLGQTEQNFTWLLLVDRQLPAPFLQRLESLVRARKKTFIHVFDPLTNLACLEWLRDYELADGPVITTNLDDDDCIPSTFVAGVQAHLTRLQRQDSLPPIGIIGAKSALEWDFSPSPAAPLGWKAPWHRTRWVMSVGFSLYCKFPEFNICVLSLRHAPADTYLDFTRAPASLNALWFRGVVMNSAAANKVDLRSGRWKALFHDISQDLGAVLLLNHATNDQSTRLLEQKAGRMPVTGADDFPTFTIDWQKAAVFARSLYLEGCPSKA